MTGKGLGVATAAMTLGLPVLLLLLAALGWSVLVAVASGWLLAVVLDVLL